MKTCRAAGSWRVTASTRAITAAGCLGIGALLCLAAVVSACAPTGTARDGLVGGRVLMAPGLGLAGAQVSIDQLRLSDGKAEVRTHIGEVVTDKDGYFEALPTGLINGLMRFTVSGGEFVDMVSGSHIQLDPSRQLVALHWLDVYEDRSKTIYITPVHALVATRFRYRISEPTDAFATSEAARAHTLGTFYDAYQHLDGHLGNLDWDQVVPADLTVQATSPTDEVRASFVLGGLSVMADDIRAASGASSQDVNVMTLVEAFEQDLSAPDHPSLDGNDDNAVGGGLQVGSCAPVASCTDPPPQAGCPDACRTSCDVYIFSYKGILAGAVSKLIGSPTSPSMWNKTSLSVSDARVLIDGIAGNVDPDLFGNAATCIDTADRIAPTIGWDAPSPDDGAFVRGMVTVRIAVTDDLDPMPKASFDHQVDTDGDLTNSVAVATLDTRMASDGPVSVTAVALDRAGNRRTVTRTFQADNTPPVVTLDSTGLFVDLQNVWWSSTDAPVLQGTITDAQAAKVEIAIGGNVVGTGTISGTTWTAQLRAGALGGSNDVTVRGIDLAGNVGTTVQTIRLDADPPSVRVAASNVFDEADSHFSPDNTQKLLQHVPGNTQVDLSTTSGCPTVHKHVHLLSQPGANGAHSVIGSSGPLNPLTFNVLATDAGSGVVRDSVKYRVGLADGHGGINFLRDWTPMTPGALDGQFSAPLYRDGPTGIPALGTTNGEYHVELQAKDQFGRTSTTERCWTHVILGSPLVPVSASGDVIIGGSGEQATGFQRALFSTSLNPQGSQTGDFAAKFLNGSPAGAALWIWRVQNYLGVPVYVTVNIAQGVRASVDRTFAVRTTFINEHAITPVQCVPSDSPCSPGKTTVLDTSTGAMQNGIVLRARLFPVSAMADTDEIFPCPGCTSNNATQTYQFEIPARTVTQGGSLPGYAMLTYLVATQPAGQGTDVLMAPSSAAHPDPGPYSEFTIPGATAPVLTGRLLNAPPGEVCSDSHIKVTDPPTDLFFCFKDAARQPYLALTHITYTLLNALETTYSFSATPSLPTSDTLQGKLPAFSTSFTTDETSLP